MQWLVIPGNPFSPAGPWTLTPGSPFIPAAPLPPVQMRRSGWYINKYIQNSSNVFYTYKKLDVLISSNWKPKSGCRLTLFSRVSGPARSPLWAWMPWCAPGTWRAFGPWNTRFPRWAHCFLNRSWLTTYFIDECVKFAHLFCTKASF